jgi:hypothetical protein
MASSLFRAIADLLREEIRPWLADRRDKIDRAYLFFDEHGVRAIAIQKAVRYDADLQDEAANFDLRIAQDSTYDALGFNVLVVPPPSSEDGLATMADTCAATRIEF